MKRFNYKASGFEAELSSDGKRIYVTGDSPFELAIEVDHDDVNHETVEQQTRRLVDLLAIHWKHI